MCLAQGHNAVAPARLEPTDTQSQVKHSTTIVNLNFSILKIRSGVCCTYRFCVQENLKNSNSDFFKYWLIRNKIETH